MILGTTYLVKGTFNMKKRETIYLASRFITILSLLMAFGFAALFYACVFVLDSNNIYILIILPVDFLFCITSFYLSLSHKIVVDREVIIFQVIKKRVINIKDIISIYVDEKRIQNLNVIFVKTKEKEYRFSGCYTSKGLVYNCEKTKKIVEHLNKIVNSNI